MSADSEVKKLKDLVKKLELQNQHLRYKTGKFVPGATSRSIPASHDLLPDNNPEQYTILPDGIQNDSRYKEVQRLNECSWLFSIDGRSCYEDPTSLLAWLRHELDHPATRDLEYARRDVISDLEAELKAKITSVQPKITSKAKRAPADNLQTDTFEYNETPTYDFGSNFESTSPDPEPDDVPAYQNHGHVRHMPLPSHTMTMESHGTPHTRRSVRSASPSSTQRVRGTSPSNSHSYSKTHKSPTRRGSSPSRRNLSPTRRNQSPVRRGQSPQRNNDLSVNLDQFGSEEKSMSRLSDRSTPRRYRSPSPGGRVNSSRSGALTSTENGTPQRYRSPSPGDRVNSSRSGVVSTTEYSAVRRYRSPSPGDRVNSSRSGVITSTGNSTPRRYRSPSPGDRVNSSRSGVMTSTDGGTPRRYRSPSPGGRSATSSKSATFAQRDLSYKNSTESLYTPRASGLSKSGILPQRDSQYKNSTESLYTPRSSGIKPPSSASRIRTPRSNISKLTRSSLGQNDMRRAMSTEEIPRASDDLVQRGRSGNLSRRALPRPSHSSGISSPKYVSPRHRTARDYVSPPSQDQMSPRSDTKSDPSDVWNDGEFF